MSAKHETPGTDGALASGRVELRSVPTALRCRSALLLQGPAGFFFARFAAELRSLGARATKVNFHAGDAIFCWGRDTVFFFGSPEEWPAYVRRLMTERAVDALFLFGDCRPYHRAAIAAAKELGIAVWVFEEGYLRPDYITLERDGVNGYSRLPRDPDVYRRALVELPALPAPEPVLPSFGPLGWYSTFSALAYTFSRVLLRRYQHHRSINSASHTFWGLRNAVRKYIYRITERDKLQRILESHDGRYFVVPLQVHNDFQFVHSPYPSVEPFIDEVVASFARHARREDAIVLKHHPFDRGYREYGDLFADLTRKHGLEGRLFYVHDVDLNALLDHARGTITVNSTVGLTSLGRGTPTKVLGTAIYDLPGLTHQGSLESFFDEPGTFDRTLYEGFCHYLRVHNQANGNFWRRLPSVPTSTGVRWFPESPDASTG